MFKKKKILIKILDTNKTNEIKTNDIKWAIGKDVFKKFKNGDIIFIKKIKIKKNGN